MSGYEDSYRESILVVMMTVDDNSTRHDDSI